ncbi:MAG: SDR family oxidoreductase [Bacteroidales bacterium]|nr:SDR family oxidoreductase [Bacteroidales bacterium]
MNFELKQHRLLITGGAGFIGSALCEAFLLQDNEVVCLDNFLTGFRKNIEPFLSNPRFTFIEGDIRDPDTCKKACDGIEYVFHQAALGSVPRSIENPARTNEINITGTLNMLIAARDARVKRFVYASSSSVYGSSKKLPKVEEETGEPLSPYAVTKVVNEKYARIFHDIYGLETTSLRYFNVFGRRQDPHGAYAAVIPKWVSQLMKHERPVINGDGSYSRDFTYIDNVVQANELAALAPTPSLPHRSPRTRGTGEGVREGAVVFNIAYGANTTLNELFNILRDNLSRFDPKIARIEPIYGPERPGDIPYSHASIEKARAELGYNPRFDARKGFELACEWYHEHLR